jgi:hypothetical protein
MAIIKRYTRYNTPIYVQECVNGTFTSTAGDTWVSIGTTKATKFAVEGDEFTDTGDAGTVVTTESIVKQVKITTTQMERDAATRNFLQGTEGKYYKMAIGGPTLTTTTQQLDVLVGKFNLSYDRDYELGYTNITFGTLANTAAVAVTPPTALTTSTAAVTIAIGKMYNSADVPW